MIDSRVVAQFPEVAKGSLDGHSRFAALPPTSSCARVLATLDDHVYAMLVLVRRTVTTAATTVTTLTSCSALSTRHLPGLDETLVADVFPGILLDTSPAT